MAKKGITIWFFSSLTFISLLHLIDAISALVFNNGTRLLQLYPVIGEKLQVLTPPTYFWASAASTLVFWGITCAIAFENPVETFLNKILADAKKQTSIENETVRDKSEILDLMYETIESDNEILAQVKDLMCNVRADVKDIEPLKETMEKVRTELSSVKKEIKKIEENVHFPNLCLACGKPLLPEFKVCPYCGETVKVQSTQAIELKNYK